MTFPATPFLNVADAEELFDLLAAKSKRERKRLNRLGLLPHELLTKLRKRNVL